MSTHMSEDLLLKYKERSLFIRKLRHELTEKCIGVFASDKLFTLVKLTKFSLKVSEKNKKVYIS